VHSIANMVYVFAMPSAPGKAPAKLGVYNSDEQRLWYCMGVCWRNAEIVTAFTGVLTVPTLPPLFAWIQSMEMPELWGAREQGMPSSSGQESQPKP
jgi:hypothetical protein